MLCITFTPHTKETLSVTDQRCDATQLITLMESFINELYTHLADRYNNYLSLAVVTALQKWSELPTMFTALPLAWILAYNYIQ